MFFFSSLFYYSSSTSPIFIFFPMIFFFYTLGKAWSCWIWIALVLSKLKFYLCGPHFTLAFHHPLMFSFPNVNPSVHVCASPYARSPWEGEFVCECVCVCAWSFVRLSHHVQSCSCVSWVDVLKWGHFLSVWCLRNNPTAQKLLQPSASTYLSLYLYCSGYAFSVLLMSSSCCLVTACYDTITWSVWCLPCCSQYEVLMLFVRLLFTVCTRLKKNVLVRYSCKKKKKISDLGSNVCGTVLIWSVSFFCFFFFTKKKHARYNAC